MDAETDKFFAYIKGAKTKEEAEVALKALLHGIATSPSVLRRSLKEALKERIKLMEQNPGDDPTQTAFDVKGLKLMLNFVEQIDKHKPKAEEN